MKAPNTLRFLVTAGPTREFLDPIRYISNRSSGKMGYAIAVAARAVSPQVTLVSGPTALKPPQEVQFLSVTTAQEMAEAVWSRFDRVDICIMAAAVGDFRPKRMATGKIKKGAFAGMLELEATTDILAELGCRKKSQVLIGFAAETDDMENQAREKLARKKLDFIVANDSSAFDAETSRVTFIGREGKIERLSEMPKVEIAKLIVERAVRLIQCPRRSAGFLREVGADLFEAVVLAEIIKVGVFDEPARVVIPELDGLAQRRKRRIQLFHQRVAAREVIEHECVVRAKFREPLVDSKAFLPLSHLGVGVAKNLQRLDEIWVTAGDPLEKPDLEFEVFLPGGFATWQCCFTDRQHGDQFLYVRLYRRGAGR